MSKTRTCLLAEGARDKRDSGGDVSVPNAARSSRVGGETHHGR